MFTYKFLNFNKINFINIFISLIPLTLILGNLATNINIILICLLGFINYKKKIFFIENKVYQYLIYAFFLWVIVTTLINYFFLNSYPQEYENIVLKTFFNLRFLIIFLIITKLIEEDKFDIKFFYISCAFFSLIISVDVTYQYIFKKNILNLPLIADRASSFFGEELIAGGFIQRFILFFIFLFAIKKKNKYNYINTISILAIIFFIPLILTGNKMSLIIFISSILIFLLSEKKFTRVVIIFFSFFVILSFLFSFDLNKRLKLNFNSFLEEAKIIIFNSQNYFSKEESQNNKYAWKTGYLIHFNTGIEIWKENKIIGNGLKSFRLKCSYDQKKKLTCNTHPHNYFIELIVDTGIVGIILIYSIILTGLINYIIFYVKEKNINFKLTTIIFFLLILFEFFPVRSTGSFFTTGNLTFIFLILPVFLHFKKIKIL